MTAGRNGAFTSASALTAYPGRELMQQGQRPVGVGFSFSLGHSAVVVLLSIGVAFAASPRASTP